MRMNQRWKEWSFWLLWMPVTGFAQAVQEEYIISGTVRDNESGQLLIGVHITLEENPSYGTITGDDGIYTLKVTPGTQVLRISYIGYEKEILTVHVNKPLTRNIFLRSSDIGLEEIIIREKSGDANIKDVRSGMEKIEMQEINKLPVLLGEKDILKSIQLLPGVRATGEGSSGIFVRGGSADQNEVLLDNIPLYNTSHLMGFFSVFNSDVIRDATLYKGSAPARFGGRLSSVLDIQTINGDTEQYNFTGTLGLISSKLTIDGPIRKSKSSFVISGRRTYADLMAKAIGAEEAENTSLYFYDLNVKMNFILSTRDNLYFSGYLGRDKAGMRDLFTNSYGNMAGSVRWTHNLKESFLMNTYLIYNRYSAEGEDKMDVDMKTSSGIEDYILKQDYYYSFSPGSQWRFGFSSSYHIIGPGKFKYEADSGTDTVLQDRYSWENVIHFNHQLNVTDKLELLYGLRFSNFSVLGKGYFYELDQNQVVTDINYYKSGEIVKNYVSIKPRLSVKYGLSTHSSVKASYARTTQNVHLLANTAMSELSERWISGSNNIKMQIADQFSIGYFHNFADNRFEFSVEAYYRDMRNQIDYKDNAQTFRKDDIETELLFGKGRAYGIEWILRKRSGRLTGWMGYTLSKSEKKINGINSNKWYNATQDRTHDISIVGMYDLNEKWSFSGTWVYYTGNAVTYPGGKYLVDGYEVPYYTERNGYRAPAYHRLDLMAIRTYKKKGKCLSELTFGLYNAYGRENPYRIEFKVNKNDPSKLTAYQYSLFKFMPSVSWNFKF